MGREKVKAIVAAGIAFGIAAGVIDVGQGEAINGAASALLTLFAAFRIGSAA